MAKLLPPLIEGTIPAFYSENGMVKITIPFSMNRAVSASQVRGFAIRIKTAQSSSYLYTGRLIDTARYNLENSPWVEFYLGGYSLVSLKDTLTSLNNSLKDQTKTEEEIQQIKENIVLVEARIAEQEFVNKIKIGQFYKCQIAYLDSNEEVGYYSSVGVSKYTTKPNLSISNLSSGSVNMHYYYYEGKYSQQDGDTTERVYSYQFNLYDENNDLIETSGEQLHNSSNDVELYESYDSYKLPIDLDFGKIYYIQYVITTINGLIAASPKYRLVQQFSVDPEILTRINVELNQEEGYINISLTARLNQDGDKEPASGTFVLSRASEEDNYVVWDELYQFRLMDQIPTMQLWKDMTVEQGKKYKYSIQQYSSQGLYSTRIESSEVYVDFEYAFLFDGKRQLKIKYNPKITSFKANVLETKTDTIGGKHPFIFRNGKVYYREFPISGLISHLMDEEELFVSKEELRLDKDLLTSRGRKETADKAISELEYQEREKLTNLSAQNVSVERRFKLEVLKWLTNGETKIFRSPTEGNYIVRLMNTSLSPNDTLGRMLHTFTCTAYEVADYTYENLKALNLLELNQVETEYEFWQTVQFSTHSYDDNNNLIVTYHPPGVMNDYDAYEVEFFDMRPGTMISLIFTNGKTADIIIGLNGRYKIEDDIGIRVIRTHTQTTGWMTYKYKIKAINSFDKIANLRLEDVPARQFIGEHDIIQEIEYVSYKNNEGQTIYIKNPKVDITMFYYIYARIRNEEPIEKHLGRSGYYYYRRSDEDCSKLLYPDKTVLYKIKQYSNNQLTGETEYVDYSSGQAVEFNITDRENKLFVNGNNSFILEDTNLIINSVSDALGGTISYYPIKNLKFDDLDTITSLVSSNGLVTEVGYQLRIIDYAIEDDPRYQSYNKKMIYNSYVSRLENYISSNDYNYATEQQYRAEMNSAYDEFILTLAQELAENNLIE